MVIVGFKSFLSSSLARAKVGSTLTLGSWKDMPRYRDILDCQAQDTIVYHLFCPPQPGVISTMHTMLLIYSWGVFIFVMFYGHVIPTWFVLVLPASLTE